MQDLGNIHAPRDRVIDSVVILRALGLVFESSDSVACEILIVI